MRLRFDVPGHATVNNYPHDGDQGMRKIDDVAFASGRQCSLELARYPSWRLAEYLGDCISCIKPSTRNGLAMVHSKTTGSKIQYHDYFE
ncbi:hypothetical protein PHLCEN_2v8611 [Hermanssonia centrifuga]|uniref:Uncharacterized protein n=1 Tax=Hermanssonia centrifuga TaxID=98765 RepID=A0A2R6NT57_9APHY|nr:hypothetical protein PHLCEN_2v8611 [Hermanssonia centrifuga]